jgi:beta-1,4-N-acetylglucosaminyltransferase
MFLLSVGTTKFEGLVRTADALLPHDGLFQIADGKYLPRNHPYVRFTRNLRRLISEADFVICHAGTGVLFQCLQLNKKVICVPNLERSDKHQLEIAEELERRGMIILVKQHACLKDAIECLADFEPKKFDIPPFQTTKFCRLADINDNQSVAILASGGGHIEEARILANSLISYKENLSIDFYIPFDSKLKGCGIHDSFTVHFRPYSAKYRSLVDHIEFVQSAIFTVISSLSARIPRWPNHVISVGTADTAILFARLGSRGARKIVLESRARVYSLSHTVKVLRLFDTMLFKQWETSRLNAPSVGVLFD